MLSLLIVLFLHAKADISFNLELKKILHTHETSTSYSEWKLHDYYPSHKLEELYTYAVKAKKQNSYCASLLQLSKLNLYFLDSFLIPEKTIHKDCHKKINTHLVSFRETKKLKLQSYIKTHFKKSSTSLPTKKLFIDPNGGKVLHDGNLSDNHYLLTFDDGPHPRVTPRVLQTLKNNNILSQFFVVGNRIQYWPELIKKTHKLGHGVGNHSWSHPDMRKLSLKNVINQIESTFDAIQNEISPTDPFFRFPYGAYKFPQLEYLAENNVVSFFWNIDTFDWKIKDPEDLLKFSIEQIKEKPSGIVLMHDIHNQTADMLPFLLDYLNSKSAQTVIFQSH